MQLVRDQNERHNYANDYVELRKFVEYAQEKDIAIILDHHLRKMPDNDPINMVSGSTGLLGAVDSILVLEKEVRTENKAKLYITGRRVRDQVQKLEFEETTNVWRFVEYVKNTQSPMDKLINGIQRILQSEKRFKGTPTELVERIKENVPDFDIPVNAMSRLLNENSISLRKSYGIYYNRERSASQRLIVLSQLKEKNNDAWCDDIFSLFPACKEDVFFNRKNYAFVFASMAFVYTNAHLQRSCRSLEPTKCAYRRDDKTERINTK